MAEQADQDDRALWRRRRARLVRRRAREHPLEELHVACTVVDDQDGRVEDGLAA